jgi:hypothetical protein
MARAVRQPSGLPNEVTEAELAPMTPQIAKQLLPWWSKLVHRAVVAELATDAVHVESEGCDESQDLIVAS